jgi:tetratricopeptide (TPR) repeat protein
MPVEGAMTALRRARVGVLLAAMVVLAASPLPAQTTRLASEADRRAAVKYFRGGIELLGVERWDQAVEAFRQAVTYDPLFVDAYYGMGQAHMSAQRFASAIQAYTQCLEAARTVHGLRQRDRVLADRQIDDEIRELRDSIRRAQSGQIKGLGELTVTRFDQRIQELERDRSSLGGPFTPPPGVMLALGSAHFRNGDRAAAEQEWTEAATLDPKLGEAWNNLAVIYLQSQRKKEAADAVSRAERAGFRVNPRLKDDIKKMPG